MNQKQNRMRISLKKVLGAIFVIGCGVTGLLLFQQGQDSNAINSGNISETIPQGEVKPSAQTSWKALRSRPQAAHPNAAIAIGPPEDSDAAREWARNNPQDALAWLLNAPAGAQRDTVAEATCAHIAEYNPAKAVSLAERYSGGCSNLLENLVQQWADQDEPSASAYALSKSPGEERDRLLSRVVFVRSKENPLEAAKLVAEWIAPGEVQNEASMSVLHQWALRDPKGALAWAELFSEEKLRDRALKEVAVMFPNQVN